MTTNDFFTSLGVLFGELIDGPPTGEGYILNPGDQGLLRSLDQLSASAASTVPPAGGASIAAHVDHVRFGLELLNRWNEGEENPWSTADWTASWRRTSVTAEEWERLRAQFRDQAQRWHRAIQTPRDVPPIALKGIIGSVAHLAYHLGAMRQIDRSIRGPQA
jgi:hypothetical protein